MALRDILRFRSAEDDNPRKPVTGTSYDAEGNLKPDPNVYEEQGSSLTSIVQKGPPELRTKRQRVLTFDEMLDNDATVDLSSRAVKTPVTGADYYIEPYSNKQEDIDIAEFIGYNLFEGLNIPFLMVIEEALRMMDYGHSVFEQVYEIREWTPKRERANARRYTMLRKLAPRPTQTIESFLYDDHGGPAGVKHIRIDKEGKRHEEEIGINKLVIFTNNPKGGNLEGKSILRTSHKNWWYKNILYKIDGIQKERHATGVPSIDLVPGYSKSDVNRAWQMVRNIRTNERAGFVNPPGWKAGFVQMETAPVDPMKSIEHHDAHILLNVMAQFLVLGVQGGGGARATSGSHQDMFQKSMRYLATLICEHFNLYVIPRLVAYNFRTTNFPQLSARNIGESKELQQWASAISRLINEKIIIPDDDFEDWVRKIVDAPKRTQENADRSKNGATQQNKPVTSRDGQGNTGRPDDAAD